MSTARRGMRRGIIRYSHRFLSERDINHHQQRDLRQALRATLSHDADGNLTDDESHAWTWDGENRLIVMLPSDGPSWNRKVVCDYDYMNRLVRRRVYRVLN